jgi:hypothetical protein
MAFISNSNFRKTDLETVSNIHEVTIFNAITDEAINGLMQENLSLNFSGSYSNIKDYAGDLVGTTIQKIDAFQLIPTNNVSTAQIYDGGDYLDLSIKLRMTDSTGDGTPLKAAALLGQWVSPWHHKWDQWDTTQVYIEDKINRSSNKSRLTGESPHAIRKSANEGAERTKNKEGKDKLGATNAGGKYKDSGKSLLDGNSGQALTELLSLVTDVKLTVMIGDWFLARGNMILKNVTQTFSQEQGPAGPMYIDFDIQLQSLTILTKRNVIELFPLVAKNTGSGPFKSYATIQVSQDRAQQKPVSALSDEEREQISRNQDTVKQIVEKQKKNK